MSTLWKLWIELQLFPSPCNSVTFFNSYSCYLDTSNPELNWTELILRIQILEKVYQFNEVFFKYHSLTKNWWKTIFIRTEWKKWSETVNCPSTFSRFADFLMVLRGPNAQCVQWSCTTNLLILFVRSLEETWCFFWWLLQIRNFIRRQQYLGSFLFGLLLKLLGMSLSM